MTSPKALLASRYRAFSDPVRIQLAPITLIIGKNGGGKSVISRLPLLMSSRTTDPAQGPLDLMAGGIIHAARYEELSYKRSSQPFHVGAEVSVDGRIVSFCASMQYVHELHKLVLSEFLYKESGAIVGHLKLPSVDALLSESQSRWILTAGRQSEKIVECRFDGLFPELLSTEGGSQKAFKKWKASFTSVFDNASYLGPFRAEAATLTRRPRQGLRSLGSRGEHAIDFLLADAVERTGDMNRSVEGWFQDQMNGTGLRVENSGAVPTLVSHDPARGIDVDLSETGVGFAQVLPIVVQAFAVRMRVLTSRFVILEQPELHLHPAAHGGVADLLVDTCLVRPDVVQICETHSEQIITRIRRRVAEGKIKADDVVILSVDHQSESGEPSEPLRTIRLDRFGSPDAWPLGVFDEALDDLTALRKAAQKLEPESV